MCGEKCPIGIRGQRSGDHLEFRKSQDVLVFEITPAREAPRLQGKAGSPQVNKVAQHHSCLVVSDICTTPLKSNSGRRLHTMEERELSIADVKRANQQQLLDAGKWIWS